MTSRSRISACVITTVALMSAGLVAQGRGGGGPAGWTTNGNDAQRSGWVRSDTKISPETMAKPGFQLLWKLKLDAERRQLNALTAPVTIPTIGFGYRGIKALAFLGGSSDKIYAIDYELGRLEWSVQMNYSSIVPPPSSSWACPGGLTAAPTRPTVITPAPAGAPAAVAAGRGGGGRATSAVGEPGRGAVAPAPAAGGRGGAAPPPPPSEGAPAPARGAAPAAAPAANAPAPPARGGGGGGGFGGGFNAVTVVSADGFVHTLNVQNGAEPAAPVEFLPTTIQTAGGIILADNVLYAAVSGACGGVRSAVYAVGMASQDKKAVSWKAEAGSIVGTAGPALGSNGTVYVATGDGAGSVVALEPKTLRLKDTFSPAGVEFRSSPVVFPYKGKDLVAVSGNNGTLYLLDSTSLGGADHKTPLATAAYAAPGYITGALATWESPDGSRWVLAPTGRLAAAAKFPALNGPVTTGAVAAFKVVDAAGRLSLEPAWISRNMTSPLPPIVVNGVVFAVSSGEDRSATSAAAAVQRSTPAVLYALDGITGKMLWSSGTTVTSFAHSGGLTATLGQVYFPTYDGTLWAFGMPMERQ